MSQHSNLPLPLPLALPACENGKIHLKHLRHSLYRRHWCDVTAKTLQPGVNFHPAPMHPVQGSNNYTNNRICKFHFCGSFMALFLRSHLMPVI